MDASIIVCTRNRAHALPEALDAIATAIRTAGEGTVELVVVDNGSTDDTPAVLRDWSGRHEAHLRMVREERVGISCARNAGLRASAGRLIVFTDDDCQPAPDYLIDLFAYDLADGNDLILRGGRVDLGDPADQPFTIITRDKRRRHHRTTAPVRAVDLADTILGCNMACRREVFERVGLFDERFGKGGVLRAADDVDFVCRAYLAGVTIEYVPDMVVRHFHGRREVFDIQQLLSAYDEAAGAIHAKFCARDPALLRPLYWDLVNLVREFRGRAPDLGFGHRFHIRLASKARGALRYWKHALARRSYREPRLENS